MNSANVNQLLLMVRIMIIVVICYTLLLVIIEYFIYLVEVYMGWKESDRTE